MIYDENAKNIKSIKISQHMEKGDSEQKPHISPNVVSATVKLQ